MATATAPKKVVVKLVGNELRSDRGTEGYVKPVQGRLYAFYPNGRFWKDLGPAPSNDTVNMKTSDTVHSMSSPALPVATPTNLPVAVSATLVSRKNPFRILSKRVIMGNALVATIVLSLVLAGTFASAPQQNTVTQNAATAPTSSAQVQKKFLEDFASEGMDLEWSIEKQFEQPYLKAIVKGTPKNPDEELAVDFIHPGNKRQKLLSVDSEAMLYGRNNAQASIEHCQEGTYFLVLRSPGRKKDIVKKTVIMSLGKVEVKDVKFTWVLGSPQYLGNPSGKAKFLKSVELVIAKEGNMPVTLDKCSLKFNGKHLERMLSSTKWVDGVAMDGSFFDAVGKLVMENTHTAISRPWTNALFEPGARYRLEGKLFYGEQGKKSTDFSKEVTVD
jgi:hypothetical protein